MSQVIDLKTFKDSKKKRMSYSIKLEDNDVRLTRIKESLNKINQLMAELKEKTNES